MAVKTFNLKPLGDKIIIERIDVEEKSPGGVYIPDTAKEKPQQGKVVAVGGGRLLDNGQKEPMEVKEGQTVLYGKYSGTEIKIDGNEYLILSQKDILAIVG